ncbi:MAG TPA: hypothetical protein DDW52_09090, partial [Planctomycetaceae bacterium]|nr:hypothetical protein [Planctomycetaceae bacterium]
MTQASAFQQVPKILAWVCLFVLSLSTCARTCFAEPPTEVLPEHERVGDLKSPAEFFDFEIGSRHLRHDQVVSYLKYLSDASDRVTLVEYGKTHGQRPLATVIISSANDGDQLEILAAKRQEITQHPDRPTPSEAKLVMYMGYGVHGDEASAMNAVPLVAYHLASSLAAEVLQYLQNGIYIVDPALNPDGNDRFANWANENRGQFPSADAADREHQQPWPGGRTNYYWFDLNRDWLPTTHPESQGRLKLLHKWKPNVVLDYHEMSGSGSYFFQPGIPARNNPLTPSKNLELTRRFAAEHAKSMNAAGELFYTEESFDDFYIGKGSTYPDLHGSVGILFEQGSTRGLKLKNDRTNRHFRDAIANQVRTSLSSLAAANANRADLLDYQREFYANAIAQAAASDVTAYILKGTESRIDAAAGILNTHSITCYQPASAMRLDGITYPATEVLVVPTNQPEYTFLRSLMEPMQSFRENIFYDVSTWHLPSSMDLEYVSFSAEIPANWLANRWQVKNTVNPNELSEGAANGVGFAFAPTELGAAGLAATIQTNGGHLRVGFKTVQPDRRGPKLPRGTYYLLKQPNAENWDALCQVIAREASAMGIEVHPLSSSMTSRGPDLGSDNLVAIPKCNPLLVVGEGTRAYTAGAIWHHLDHRMRQPATLVETSRLRSVDLNSFSCIILPDGSFGGWSAAEASALKDYVRQGGTVIGVATAIKWMASNDLININTAKPKLEQKTVTSKEIPFGEASSAAALESIAGAFLMTRVDQTHPLAFGFPDGRVPVFRDHSAMYSSPSNTYQVAARYTGVEAGYVSRRNRDQLSDSVAVWAETYGSGRFIMLAENPVFR